MNNREKQRLLGKFKLWFKDSIVESHKRNTEKLIDIKKFNINPFLLYYLSNYLEGNSEIKSLAKVLVYPRVLGTSITTSFGQHMQNFITKVFGAYGSTTSGIDIEYIDHIDNRKKYCQLKSGPNAINRGDVETISNHFKGIKNLARTNRNLNIQLEDLVLCLTYGEPEEKNSFIRELENDYNVTVHIGKNFWHRFTGDEDFYRALILAAGEVANDIDMKSIVDDVIEQLSTKIEDRFDDLIG